MSSDTPVVIEVERISKAYQIYETPRARLAQLLVPPLQRRLGLRPSVFYTPYLALEDVSFRIRAGETVGIIGRNGSGKSTLLQIICGTLSPSAGTVNTAGRIAALLELGSGFNPEFSGRENVYLNAAILGLSRQEVDDRYESIVAFADIGSFIDQPIKTYSSGMVVRLAFATAIHVDPEILVVDEALAVGDTAFQQKCLNRIREMQRQGVSILLVTHSSNTLIDYCDRGIYLRRGRLVMDGACRDVVKAYTDHLVEEEGGITIAAATVEMAAVEGGMVKSTPALLSVAPPVELPAEVKTAMMIEAVEITDAKGHRRSAFEHGDLLKIRVSVRIGVRVEEPCFGIQLSSPDGIALWSATTQQLERHLGALAPGVYTYTWDLQANFSGNRYVVALGVGRVVNGEYRRLHRVDYAGHFDVIPMAHAGGGWLAPLPRFNGPDALLD